MRIFLFISILLISGLAFYTNTIDIIFPWGFFLFILRVVYRNQLDYRKVAFVSYLYLSIMGVLAYVSYILFASLSFAPFVDDGYYYYNIQTIWSGNVNNDINYTLYEFVVAIVYAPLLLVFKNIEHYMLLPFNWFLGTIFVTESIRFAWKIVPIKNSKKVFCSFFILLNYSCVDAFVHLYRDSLMLIFYVISLSFILKKQYVKGIMASLLTSLVRGANGMLALLYLLFNMIPFFFSNRRRMIILVCGTLLLFPYVINRIDYNKLGRISSNDQSSVTIKSRIENMKNGEGAGGVLNLLRSSNPVMNFVALPVYMISPLKVRNAINISEYKTYNQNVKTIFRLKIESLWEFIHVIFYSCFSVSLFCGIYYWLKNSDKNTLMLFFLFFISLALITFISMQTRHKIIFIMFFPVLYNYFYKYKSLRSVFLSKIMSYVFIVLLLVYNILM